MGYRVADEGPEHEKLFTAEVVIDGQVFGTATGRTKKDAEQGAAAAAWRELQERPIPAVAVGD